MDTKLYTAIVGRVIQRARGALKLNQAMLARRSGLSQSALSRFENGQSMPDFVEIRSLAHALDVAPGYLFVMAESAYDRATDIIEKLAATTQQPPVGAIADLAVAQAGGTGPGKAVPRATPRRRRRAA